MNLLIETDLGHDPDDFFAICYLASIENINIKGIVITPGDPHQIAIAEFLIKELSLPAIIGVTDLNRSKNEIRGVHKLILKKYKYPLESCANLYGYQVYQKLLNEDPNLQILTIGPVKNFNEFYKKNKDITFSKITIQGGFVPYTIYKPKIQLDKFENKKYIQTFNLNGCIEGATNILKCNAIEKRIVSKNICHTVVYNEDVHQQIMNVKPKNRAGELLREGMSIYLNRHPKGKKFHDPTAAVCHLHPEIATWIKGKLIKDKTGWGTVLNEKGYDLIADINYSKLWEHIAYSY